MPLDHWAKRPDGSIIVGPLLSSEVVISDNQGAMRLMLAYDNKQFKAGGQPVQLTLTAAQAHQLGIALMTLAKRLGPQKKPTIQ